MKKDKSKIKTEFLNIKTQNSQNKYFNRMTEEKKINTQNRKKKKIENVRLWKVKKQRGSIQEV